MVEFLQCPYQDLQLAVILRERDILPPAWFIKPRWWRRNAVFCIHFSSLFFSPSSSQTDEDKAAKSLSLCGQKIMEWLRCFSRNLFYRYRLSFFLISEQMQVFWTLFWQFQEIWYWLSLSFLKYDTIVIISTIIKKRLLSSLISTRHRFNRLNELLLPMSWRVRFEIVLMKSPLKFLLRSSCLLWNLHIIKVWVE